MRVSYPFLQPGEKPITTVDEYLKYRAALGDMAHAGYFVSDEAWADP